MLESFIKSMISVKARPNSNYIKGCGDLLRLVQTSDAQETLLPALHKAMLRSPETIIQAVGEVFANLNIDVDGIAVDIGKNLIGEGILVFGAHFGTALLIELVICLMLYLITCT